MISNPFAFFIDWDSDVRFEYTTGDTKTPSQAQTDSIADGIAFWYDVANTTFRWGPRVTAVSSGSATGASIQLKHFVGYYVYGHKTATMYFYPNPRTPSSPTVVAQTPAPRYFSWPNFASYFAAGENSTDWEIQLTSSGTNGSQSVGDIDNYVGVRSAGSLTVRAAPATPDGGVSLSVAPFGQAGTYALHYAASLSSATWDVSSYSSAGGNVTISASGVSSLPSSVSSLLLQDLSTGTVTELKTSSYTYASSAAETRKFYLSAAGSLPGSSSSAKVIYPSMCLITRTLSLGSLPTQLLRSFRDALLNTSFGRALVSVYYR